MGDVAPGTGDQVRRDGPAGESDGARASDGDE